jgi:hypothetical protein
MLGFFSHLVTEVTDLLFDAGYSATRMDGNSTGTQFEEK